MFFNESYIKHLEDEIVYLRKQIDEYKDIILAMSGKAVDYNSIQFTKDTINPVDEIKKKIESEPVVDEYQLRQKQEALDEMKDLGLI